jgi:hypothetical protein
MDTAFFTPPTAAVYPPSVAASPNDAAGVVAELGTSHTVKLADGQTFTWATPATIPSFSTVFGSVDGTLNSTIASTYSTQLHQVWNADAPTAINSGTLHATPAQGALTVQVDTTVKPTVGNWLQIAHGVSAQIFKILTVTGSTSPYTVTICGSSNAGTGEPMIFPFVSGDPVEEYASRPTNITVDGQGMTVSAPTSGGVQFARALRCAVKNLVYTSTVGSDNNGLPGLAFDLGGEHNLLKRCYTSTPGTLGTGWYFQSEIMGRAVDVEATGGFTGGSILDCWSSSVTDCWSFETTLGLIVGSLAGPGPTASLGSLDCQVFGGGSVGCTDGLQIFGSVRTVVTAYAALQCTTGIVVESTSAHANTVATTDTLMVGPRATLCGTGISVGTGCLRTRIVGATIISPTTTGLSAVGDVDVDGLTITGAPATAGAVFTCSLARLLNVEASTTSAANTLQFSGTRAFLTGARVANSNAGGNAIAITAGTLYLRDVTASGPFVGLSVNAGTVYILPGCDFSGSSNPIYNGGGTVIFQQVGGVASIAGGATTTELTFAQHYCTSIEVGNGSAISSGTQTVNAHGAHFGGSQGVYPGQEFTVKNYNTTGSTTVVFGVTIPASTTYRIRCNAAGWEHVVFT